LRRRRFPPHPHAPKPRGGKPSSFPVPLLLYASTSASRQQYSGACFLGQSIRVSPEAWSSSLPNFFFSHSLYFKTHV
jgi:hypothetical protein